MGRDQKVNISAGTDYDDNDNDDNDDDDDNNNNNNNNNNNTFNTNINRLQHPVFFSLLQVMFTKSNKKIFSVKHNI